MSIDCSEAVYLSDFDSYARKNSIDNFLNNNKTDESDTNTTEYSNRMPFSPSDRIKHVKIRKYNKDKHKILHVDKYASILF